MTDRVRIVGRRHRRKDIWAPRPRRRRRRIALWAVLVAAVAIAVGWGYARWTAPASSAPPTSAQNSVTSGGNPPTTATSQPPADTGGATASAPAGEPVPILMYHVITSPPAGTSLPELFLPADQFDQQMRYLKDHGFHPVTLAQVWRYWTNGATLPVHPIVLSFDDGYRSQFEAAARTLHRYGWPGVLNLIVAHLHEGTFGLGEHDVKRMIAWGWELDSHTLTHPDLTTVHGAALTAEVSGSRRQLQHEFGVPVAFFCYPAGAYDDEVVQAVAAAGYSAATTTNEGAADPSQGRFTLDRIRINGSTTVSEFAAQLEAARSTGG